ncbi:hypothetical protein CA51_27690 [Rosistilla oblonga]|nr:hypothetical protein CA51_27690 [Rosistilla oblonga]
MVYTNRCPNQEQSILPRFVFYEHRQTVGEPEPTFENRSASPRRCVFHLLLYQAAHHSMTSWNANLWCDNELATATLKMALRHSRKAAEKCFNADLADFSELRCEPG